MVKIDPRSRFSLSPIELNERTLKRRAVEAVIWGMPLVNYDAMLQAVRRDAKGGPNQIVYWSRPSDWRNQTLTPNGEVLYAILLADTREVGPIVVEIPAAGETGVFGTVVDSWQVPLEDVGPAGADAGRGARYLILPPGDQGTRPDGYLPVASKTYLTYAPLRIIPRSWSPADLAKANTYLKQVKVYPLTQAAKPAPTRFIDVASTVFDSTIPYDLRFFQALDRMVQIEPIRARDKVMTNLLRSIGIERGKPFRPTPRTADLLASAAQEAHAWLAARFLSVLQPHDPGKRWLLPLEPTALQTQGTWESADSYDTDGRGLTYAWAFGAMKHPGNASFYLLGIRDKEGDLLRGEDNYRLTVPAKVPAGQFWSVVVYDLVTAAFLREAPRVSLSSFVEGLQENADGTVDVFFGPRPPAGKDRNWIFTKPGGSFFVLFRFYGPEKPIFDRTWRLPDLEAVR